MLCNKAMLIWIMRGFLIGVDTQALKCEVTTGVRCPYACTRAISVTT